MSSRDTDDKHREFEWRNGRSTELLRASHVARRLGVTERTVRAWIRDDIIDGVVIGRRYYVRRAAFEALIGRR